MRGRGGGIQKERMQDGGKKGKNMIGEGPEGKHKAEKREKMGEKGAVRFAVPEYIKRCMYRWHEPTYKSAWHPIRGPARECVPDE